jgi:hypothetical protein
MANIASLQVTVAVSHIPVNSTIAIDSLPGGNQLQQQKRTGKFHREYASAYSFL